MMKACFFIFSFLYLCLSSWSQYPDVVHYRFVIDINDQNDTLRGEAVIEFVNRSGKPGICFDLSAVKNGRGMKVLQVGVPGTPQKFSFQHVDQILKIQLPDADTNKKKIHIRYAGVPSDGLIISRNKFGDRTFFSDNWPNRAHHWIPCNDRPDDKASFEFEVVAPAHYKVISNGTKVLEQTKHQRTLTHWKEDTPLPSKVMVIGAARFAIHEYVNSPSGIPVSAWLYQQDSAKGTRDYAAAPEILQFFSEYIAPYPFKKLANVQSKTIYGGMENASAIFYAESSVTGTAGVEDLLAHEIVHQWFGDMASEKSFPHLWLSEGFATYLTNIYLEKKYGHGALTKRMKDDRRQVIQFARANQLPVVDSISSFSDLLNANSYQKGGWVLHMLRNELGDSGFRKVIQTYYQQFKGGNADSKDFEEVAEKVSGKELTTFFNQWLYCPGVPNVTVSWKAEGTQIKMEIVQTGSGIFHFPLDIGMVSTEGQMIIKSIQINSRRTEVKTEVPFKLQKLVLDPDTRLLFEGAVSH